MANKMLIDASHPEETRVVVVRGTRVEEFDFESANKKQLRGNIYLAKVIRVEPSLQAAFVDYGGNRHGFLAFSEIHPDYYQIPIADRQALLAEEARQERDAEQDEEGRGRRGRRRGKNGNGNGNGRAAAKDAEESETLSEDAANGSDEDADSSGEEEEVIEQVGSGDALEEVPERPRAMRRQYKIQEVIKRRQVLLVQVVKEERGNKGAALTTYLSLAGRYSVLMPNTGRGGGISRKITNAVDRKRLKSVAQELDVPEGMGVILRTAGASRTKAEIKRDFEYLMRLWETVRELTLQSSAPALVYEEGSLVKRAIRDLYNKDIDEVLVSGDAAYRDAKEFMRMLMPSHAKNVKPYKEVQPIFAKFGVESQLDAMFSSQVTLKSGGYIVINQTEALVAIDVNSGRATREHNIEDTALKTNLEAADEVARQLRLRDLAGLIVIDFIDMEEKRNNRSVERRLKEALKNDRARIQVGRISAFGLMEMSRQRIRTGVLEGSTVPCPHCGGAGIVRAVPSVALHVLRSVEENLIRANTHHLIVRTRTEVALYILNQKRSHLRGLEDRFGVDITILADEAQNGTHAFAIERGEPVLNPKPIAAFVQVDSVAMPEDIEDEAVEEIGDEEEEEAASAERAEPRTERQERRDAEAGDGGRRRRRRRRRRGGRPEAPVTPMPLDAPQPEITGQPFTGTATFEPEEMVLATAEPLVAVEDEETEAGQGEAADRSARRRRGRRGGRKLRREDEAASEAASAEAEAVPAETAEAPAEAPAPAEAASVAEAAPAPAPRVRKPRARRTKAAEVETVVTPTADAGAEATPVAETVTPSAEAPAAMPEAPQPEPEPLAAMQTEQPASEAAQPAAEPPAPAPEPETSEPVLIGSEPATPRKAGWWAKARSALGG